MANTNTCVLKECDKCKNKTRATWRYRGYFYCYPCYRDEITKTPKMQSM